MGLHGYYQFYLDINTPHPISHHKVHSIALSLLKHIVLKCIQVVRICDVTISIVSTNT